MSYELRAESLKARVESLNAWVQIQKLQVQIYELQVQIHELEFKSTSSRIMKSMKSQVNSLKISKIISPKS